MSAVARVAGIHPSQLYWWRRQLCARPLVGFASVRIAPAPGGRAAQAAIEIEFATGSLMRITGAVDTATLTGAVVVPGGDDPNSFGGARVDCTGHTNMRRGMNSLACCCRLGPLDMCRATYPFGGHLYVLHGKSSHLIKIIDGIDWRNPRHTFRPQRAGQPGSIARNYVSI